MSGHRGDLASHGTQADDHSGSAFVAPPAPERADAPAAVSDLHLPAVVLIRHGETAWSRTGQHTGRTDVPLTAAGEEQARTAGAVIATLLADHPPSVVISSPRQRAMRTAELAGYPPQLVCHEAAEWDYGEFEGLTSDQIHELYPEWSIWTGTVPGGETHDEVTARFDKLLALISEHQPAGPVLVFSHGHASRCLAARWLGEPVAAGGHYWLDTGAASSLGYEHGRAVILRWNLDHSVLRLQ